jgi:catechol 2,3-dioxygenase-like lactoylglutathione lyase family enzyme
MTSDSSSRINGVSTVGVPVTDQSRALDFYIALGFEKRLDAPFGPGLRWIEVAPPEAVTTIALMPTPEGVPTGVDTGIRLTAGSAGAVHADMLAQGIDVDAEIMRWEGVPPMFTFRDPDGNTLVIVERPAS